MEKLINQQIPAHLENNNLKISLDLDITGVHQTQFLTLKTKF